MKISFKKRITSRGSPIWKDPRKGEPVFYREENTSKYSNHSSLLEYLETNT